MSFPDISSGAVIHPRVAQIESVLRRLGTVHANVSRSNRAIFKSAETSRITNYLRDTHRYLQTNKEICNRYPRTSEWFLDNYHLLNDAAILVEDVVAPSFYERLPGLLNVPDLGLPRVYVLARNLVWSSELMLDEQRTLRCIAAYQEHTFLTVAEIWAFPMMLRLSILTAIVVSLGKMFSLPISLPEGVLPRSFSFDIDEETMMSRAIRHLRLLAVVNWKRFFDSVSQLEAELCNDPTDVYSTMDFLTRNRYREVIEEFAWRTERCEIDVARTILAVANRAPLTDHRKRHIGYYLIDRGRVEIEREIGFRPLITEHLPRGLQQYPTISYLIAILVMTAVFMGPPLWLLSQDNPSIIVWSTLTLLAFIPAWSLGTSFVQWVVTLILSPDRLPRIDLMTGIPSEAKTAVVIPAMLDNEKVTRQLISDLEIRYLSNPDANLSFVLLTDFPDAAEREMPEDATLLKLARELIEELNHRYRNTGKRNFHLLHRERRWSDGEACWKGWERKRGKIIEFNRWLRGDQRTSFTRHIGKPDGLKDIRFVITLDADTMLPKGAANELVGILLHPLNKAEFNPETNQVIAGYTIIQPRVEIDPASEENSAFTRIFGGDIGLDPYSHAVSNIYQDLFGSGIYIGKGIYDLSTFVPSLAHSIPPRRVLSHDLLEGVLGRTGLATDVVIYEHYPPHYVAYARRIHRWIRGDWQLIPWLLPLIPIVGGRFMRNPLSLIDRWKIFENLVRSLFYPSLFVFLLSGWLLAPSALLLWTLMAVLAPGAHLFLGIVTGIARGFRQPGRRGVWRMLRGITRTDSERWAMTVTFLCHQTFVYCDAIARTLVRVLITHRHLLEWVTFSRTAALVGIPSTRKAVWSEMWVSVLVATVMALLISLERPSVLPFSLPFLVLWMIAPEIARCLSLPAIDLQPASLSQKDRLELRELACRTWHFFETFVEPNNQWLPPDNYQESPRGEVAHRTSPTNIAMMFLSNVVACDLGYIGTANFVRRTRNSLATLSDMPRYRGHVLNWVDTSSVEPLEPRYVSTVDSGNLAGAFLAVRQACVEMDQQQFPRAVMWEGLIDILRLLEQAVLKVLKRAALAAPDLIDEIHSLRSCIQQRENSNRGQIRLIEQLGNERCERLDAVLLETIRDLHGDVAIAELEEIEIWANALTEHIESMRLEVETCAPWLILLLSKPDTGKDAGEVGVAQAWRNIINVAADPILLNKIVGTTNRLRDALHAWRLYWGTDCHGNVEDWTEKFEAALENGSRSAVSIRNDLGSIAETCGREVERIDFGLLYDSDRKLFHIGYNVSENRLDPHHYDLLASEARLASFIAIAKGDAPPMHWFHLSRPIVRHRRSMVMLSWSGTMFEYLMPSLLMHSNHNTLLDQSCKTAVKQQIAYARSRKVPWGISESGYYRFDPDLKYQYRAFGNPTMGLKPGLDEDLVIAPYASMLALSINPKAVVKNIHRLKKLGALGRYGFYEALDFTPSRLLKGNRRQLVRAYMAHHQGMTLCALGNYLNASNLVERFHNDPMVRSAAFLLNERIPTAITQQEKLSKPRTQPSVDQVSSVPLVSWMPSPDIAYPEVNILSNGRFTTRVTDSGAGDLQWSGLSLTRWRPDTTRDNWGYWIYLRNEETGRIGSVTCIPAQELDDEARVDFYPHKAEFHRRIDDLFVQMTICVAGGDDVEVRRLEILNESGQTRHISLTSYAEVVLTDSRSDSAHPSFEKLFTECHYEPDLPMLVFHRRKRSPEEPSVVMAHHAFGEGANCRYNGYETDRSRFLGREGNIRRPAVLDGTPLDGTVGHPLDSVMAMQISVVLGPYDHTAVNFVTAAGASSQKVRESVSRYRNDASCRWVFHEAMLESRRELSAIGLHPAQVGDVQQLFSGMLYPNPALRVFRSVSEGFRANQNALWPFGISGDLPILLLKMWDETATELLEIVLKAHHYWRIRRQQVDLVVLSHGASTYGSNADSSIRNIINRCHGQDWMDRRGGIFVVCADQISAFESACLEACALAVLDSRRGSLSQQLNRRWHTVYHLPHYKPTRAPILEPPRSLRLEGLQYENDFGGFTKDGREYVIYVENGRRPPAPWSNILANPSFGCLTTESGGGYTWFRNAGEYRLTPWTNDPVLDPPSEALYLRDEQTAESWSPIPLKGLSGNYRIHHGAGFTTFVHYNFQLEQETTILVSPEDPVKIISLRLKNTADDHRRLTVTYYAELVLGNRRSETQSHIVTGYDEELQAILADCSWNSDHTDCVTFLTASRDTHGFTCDRSEFLGRYGNSVRPEALKRVGISGRCGSGLDPCAALQIHLELEPYGQIECHFVLGAAANRDRVVGLCERYSKAGAAQSTRAKVDAHWDEFLGAISVRTPEPAMDLLLNRWLLYQTITSRIYARSGFYQSSGAYGFRDQLQDVMAVLQVSPGMARQQIIEAAHHQFDEGDVLHWWHPPSGKGVRTRCSDDLLWLPYVTAEYVATTGDCEILSEQVPFLSAPPLETGEQDRYGSFEGGKCSATLLEHCRRALKKGLTSGPNGLPLMGSGDWNDGMNRVGVEGSGESIWLGWFAYQTIDRFRALCDAAGTQSDGSEFEHWARKIRDALETTGWDGEWYRRAFYDDGTVVGSQASTECRIDSISQSWATLGDPARTERQKQALDSAVEQLVFEDKRLVALLTPAFNGKLHDPGYIGGYPPGVRENGGQYTHAAVWLAWALAEQGDGTRAEWLFRLLNPILRCADIAAVERYRVEPYVLAADIYHGPEFTGRGGWTWYTGSAAWLWRFGIEGILGLRRSGRKLIFDPCIPGTWSGFSARIRTDGSILNIEVRNPSGICRGVFAIEVDNRFIKSNSIRLNEVLGRHIIIHMGTAEGA